MLEFESPADASAKQGDNVLRSSPPTRFAIGSLVFLAIPLGFGGLLFFGVDSVAWLPTPLRMAPYSMVMGCLSMAIYQKTRGARIKETIRFSVLTGVLAGLVSTVAFYLLLIVVATGGVH